jgi:hypothetical protein
MAAFNTTEEKDWFIDSGASTHMTGDKNLVRDMINTPKQSITTAGGVKYPVEGQGNVTLSCDGAIKTVPNVVYVPSIRKNLLSVRKFANDGHLVTFNHLRCLVLDKRDPKRIYLQAIRDPYNKLYRILQRNPQHRSQIAAHTATLTKLQPLSNSQIDTWHKRIGHINY